MTEDISCREKIISNDYRDYIVNIGGNILISMINQPRACIQHILGQYRVLSIKDDSRDMNIATLGFQTIPKLYTITDSTNMDVSGITKLRNQPYLGLNGRGVLVGLIDTGIDYMNPVFRYSDGSTRIVGIWDQTVQTGQTPPGIMYGSEYTKEMIDNALKLDDPYQLVPTKDDVGHGTFMAGIAAGGEDIANDFIGAAPQASIVMVKLKEAKPYLREYFRVKEEAYAVQENDIMMGIKYLFDMSSRMGMPIVMLVTLGTNMGGHGTGTYLSNLLSDISSYVGICTVVSGGNEGNENSHYRSRVPETGETDTVELIVGQGSIGFSMEFWTTIPASVSFSIVSPTGERIRDMRVRPGSHEDFRFVFESTQITVDYIIPFGVEGENVVFLRFINPTPGLWRLQVSGNFISPEESFDIWLPVRDFMGPGTYFLRPDPYITLTDPSNTPRVITVSAYNHKDNSIYPRSGRGYNRMGDIKPDIAAPGVNIFGPAPGGGYTSQSGASVAAAHVAGGSALILEWGLARDDIYTMDTGSVKGYLIRGADRMPNMTYPNREWGDDGIFVSDFGEQENQGFFVIKELRHEHTRPEQIKK